MSKEIFINSLEKMQKLGHCIAVVLQPKDVITLRGELGVGKTELARFIIRYLMGEAEIVPSPTFTFVQTYDTYKGSLAHFDFYRIENKYESEEFNLDETFMTSMTLIEWPEKLGKKIFKNNLNIEIILLPDGRNRTILISGTDRWRKFIKSLDDLL